MQQPGTLPAGISNVIGLGLNRSFLYPEGHHVYTGYQGKTTCSSMVHQALLTPCESGDTSVTRRALAINNVEPLNHLAGESI